MGKLYWSPKYTSKTKAKSAMSKKKKAGFKTSGVYSTPKGNKYFFVAEK